MKGRTAYALHAEPDMSAGDDWYNPHMVQDHDAAEAYIEELESEIKAYMDEMLAFVREHIEKYGEINGSN